MTVGCARSKPRCPNHRGVRWIHVEEPGPGPVTVYFRRAKLPNSASRALACRSTSRGTKSRIGLCANRATTTERWSTLLLTGLASTYVGRRSTWAINTASLVSAIKTACARRQQRSNRYLRSSSPLRRSHRPRDRVTPCAVPKRSLRTSGRLRVGGWRRECWIERRT